MATSKKIPILLSAASSVVRKGSWIPIGFNAWSLSVEPGDLQPNLEFALIRLDDGQAKTVKLHDGLSNILRKGHYMIKLLGLDTDVKYSFYAVNE